MSFVDSASLASTTERINHAHLFGEQITKRDAKEANAWIVSRYWQNIPERIDISANPDLRWVSFPKSFNLTDADRRRKPKTFTGEPLANAALRMVHNREAARALFVLGGVLGKTAPEALSLCASVRDIADQLERSVRRCSVVDLAPRRCGDWPASRRPSQATPRWIICCRRCRNTATRVVRGAGFRISKRCSH
jgi:hypothetical protein